MKTNGIKWIITNGPSPFSTGKTKVQMTVFWPFSRQQVCNDPGAAVSTSYLQAKQDGTFQVVNPYLNSQFNAVQNSQVNSAPQKVYNSRQQGESNSLNLNVSMIIRKNLVINEFSGIERIDIDACAAALQSHQLSNKWCWKRVFTRWPGCYQNCEIECAISKTSKCSNLWCNHRLLW